MASIDKRLERLERLHGVGEEERVVFRVVLDGDEEPIAWRLVNEGAFDVWHAIYDESELEPDDIRVAEVDDGRA